MTDWIVNFAPEALLFIRMVAHVLICFMVATYTACEPEEADEADDQKPRHKKVIGFAAGAFAGANAAEAARVLMNFKEFTAYAQPWLTLIMLGVLYFVLISGGNMARFLPRRIVERLP